MLHFFFFLKRSGRKISVMSVTGLSCRHFGMSLHIPGWKHRLAKKRLNKEMSSRDTPSKASECFGKEPGLSCWIPSKFGNRVLQTQGPSSQRCWVTSHPRSEGAPNCIGVCIFSISPGSLNNPAASRQSSKKGSEEELCPVTLGQGQNGAQFCHRRINSAEAMSPVWV